MAGGKLSPRQKMINLMYLVFIAMLALNMSKEVLSAFGLLNTKLTIANTITQSRNEAFMSSLAIKAEDQPEQYAAVKAKADQAVVITRKLDSYLEKLKSEMMKTVKADDIDNFEVQDQPDFLDTKFFQGDKLKPGGKEFLSEMNDYRIGMLSLFGEQYPALGVSIENDFSTEPILNRDGEKVDWLNYNFEGFPLIASLTKLTQLQTDIKSNSSQLLSKILAGQQASALSFSQYTTLLESPKSAYYTGEVFDGAIVLGRIDDKTVPNRAELTLDGRKLEQGKDFSFEGGRVVLAVSAGNAGEHKLEGKLVFLEDGKETDVPVSRSFSTISPPNSATISADKMNVVYRGVKNPMTISMDGVPNNNVNANAPGLSRGSGSSYIMDVTTVKGREVKINVTGTIDGKSFPSSKIFRIKDIPRPTGTIRGEDGNGGPVRMQRQGLEISSIGAMLLDFDFDLKLNVTGFSFKVAGQPTVTVSGNKLNEQAKGALKRAKRGETVQIFDINAKIAGNSSYKLPRITPVFIELAN
ncbi:MAG: gliding motility protein GldM [Flavobacteriaceae bacterium]|jgi:gliding motility-associated protein GldM|nr:gliding motility protein GldM [Flavobacteriaceae bacterium]MBT6705671.1 gliding motility protein GldM [Flavobacteriaceae bacterium]